MTTNSSSISDEEVNNKKARSTMTAESRKLKPKAQFCFASNSLASLTNQFTSFTPALIKGFTQQSTNKKATLTSIRPASPAVCSFVDGAAVIKTGDGRNQINRPVPADVCQWRSGTRLCVRKSSSGCVRACVSV